MILRSIQSDFHKGEIMSILEEKKEQDAKKRIRQAIGLMPYGGTIGLIPMTEEY